MFMSPSERSPNYGREKHSAAKIQPFELRMQIAKKIGDIPSPLLVDEAIKSFRNNAQSFVDILAPKENRDALFMSLQGDKLPPQDKVAPLRLATAFVELVKERIKKEALEKYRRVKYEDVKDTIFALNYDYIRGMEAITEALTRARYGAKETFAQEITRLDERILSEANLPPEDQVPLILALSRQNQIFGRLLRFDQTGFTVVDNALELLEKRSPSELAPSFRDIVVAGGRDAVKIYIATYPFASQHLDRLRSPNINPPPEGY